MKILAENKKANFDYEFYEKFEAGVELFGFEVKAAKRGRFNIVGSYAIIQNNELWLINSEIAPYQPKNVPPDYDLNRNRRLLVHKSEIKYLIGKLAQKFLLIPTKVYLKNNLIKIELNLCRPRKKADKREVIKEKESRRQIQRLVNKIKY